MDINFVVWIIIPIFYYAITVSSTTMIYCVAQLALGLAVQGDSCVLWICLISPSSHHKRFQLLLYSPCPNPGVSLFFKKLLFF